MAGPKIPWRPGRIDGFATQATPDGRLPDASQGADHLRAVSTNYASLFSNINLAIPLVDLWSHGVMKSSPPNDFY